MTSLPLDTDNTPIPALRLKGQGGAHEIVVSDVAAKNTVAFSEGTRVVSLYASVPVYVRFGEVDVVASASDHYYPAGLYYDFAIGGGKVAHAPYVSAISAQGEGVLYVSEKE